MESRYDPNIVEPKIRSFWLDKKIFAFDEKSSKEVYAIDTPPPTVSGDIHLGHVFSYSQAEFIARYKRMRGYNVFYPFGLDNNGLPTELLIEKKFGIVAEDLGRDKFVEMVRREIQPYNKAYIELWQRLGLSVDWTLLYETIEPNVQRISQKSFLDLIKSNRIYRKEAAVLYCPKCKTAVSQMELEDKMLKSKIVQIRFSDDITVATSRPEMLPACVAIFVSPEDKEKKKLVGKKVRVPIFENEVLVFADSRVDPNFGTGTVMCCTFGDLTDIEWYKAYNLDLKMIINEQGRMIHPYYKGVKIKEAREKIIEDLQSKGFIVKKEDIEHSVNVHERCGTEIELLVKPQWYIKYLDLKEKFLELGNKVKWHPEFMKVRYENWVRGLQWDWSISRQRFFGVYFPVWYCTKCKEAIFADEKDLPVNPFSQNPKVKCRCGSSEFTPESDVMDTWATSSLTPLINARWGIDNKYLKKIFPMSLRVQAHDIISFWAFTTIVKSYLHMNDIPWKDIMISGHGLDPQGKPMHKSKGNVVFPDPYIKKYGADALRYWASSSVPGDDNSFQEKEVVSGSRLINKLWNVARFAEMNCKDFEAKESTNVLDEWIVSKMYDSIQKSTECFDQYDYYRAKSSAERFFWIFTNDYLEFVKDRIYANDKSASYTIVKVLLNCMKMFAPFIPYCVEEIYQNLFAGEKKMRGIDAGNSLSLHTSSWPRAGKIDEKRFDVGEKAANIIIAVRKWKHDNKFALNAQISKVTISREAENELKDCLEDVKKSMKIQEIVFGEGEIEVQEGIKISVKA